MRQGAVRWVWPGQAVGAWSGHARRDETRNGVDRHGGWGPARHGEMRQGRAVTAWKFAERCGGNWRLRRGVSLIDAVSMAVRARRGKQGFGELRSVWSVKERRLRCHTSMTVT